jgi:uncharacterized YigZ family protein
VSSSDAAPAPGTYRAPSSIARGELREQGSRFLALLEPVRDERAARDRVAALEREHANATHCCFAWRLGQPARERSSDAGEPAGTAGMPILRVLRGAGLSDSLLVVVRRFGGVKLGKGGLARAYASAARAAVEAAAFETRSPLARLRLAAPYAAVGAVQRLVHPPQVVLRDAAYGERAELVLEVHLDRLEAVVEALRELGLRAAVEVPPGADKTSQRGGGEDEPSSQRR